MTKTYAMAAQTHAAVIVERDIAPIIYTRGTMRMALKTMMRRSYAGNASNHGNYCIRNMAGKIISAVIVKQATFFPSMTRKYL